MMGNFEMIDKQDCDSPDMFTRMPRERQELLLDWIANNLYSIQSFNSRHTSYGLKHLIRLGEGVDPYFYNGEFKGAMLESGFLIQDQFEQNWVFNVSERSPVFRQNRR